MSFPSGTKKDPARSREAWMTSYTDEQIRALAQADTNEHALRIARAGFANKVLLADGTISDDLGHVRDQLTANVATAEQARSKFQAELMAAIAAAKANRTQETNDAQFAARKRMQDATIAEAKARGALLEFEEHAAQDRFLFVVDDFGTPTVYFQCAVEGNPDTPMRKEHYTPDYVAKVEADVQQAAAADRSSLAATALKILSLLVVAALARLMVTFGHARDLGTLVVGAISYKITTANYALDQLYDNKFPSTSIVELRSGAPAGPDNAAGGSLGCSITLPASPWAAAASKSKAKNGTWSNTASGAITAGHYRLKNSGDTEREEGTITATGGGGDMTLDNTSIASGQTVTINTYTRTLP